MRVILKITFSVPGLIGAGSRGYSFVDLGGGGAGFGGKVYEGEGMRRECASSCTERKKMIVSILDHVCLGHSNLHLSFRSSPALIFSMFGDIMTS